MNQGISREALLHTLITTVSSEGAQSSQLRETAIHTVESSPSISPEVCLDLLTNVIRPLFSATKNAALTSSGRKNLVPPPPSAGRFSNGFGWDESKPWKNGWMIDLLTFILSSYGEMQASTRKVALEDQFYLLIPPTLNTIDDADIRYKTDGCHLLRLLCQNISSINSDILKRTGLTDVFVGALKANFMLLPTLTPEEDSLALLSELYPAFRALVAARYPQFSPAKASTESESEIPLAQLDLKSNARPSAVSNKKLPSGKPATADRDARQSLLDLAMRHGILASYNHVSENINLSTFLLTQASGLVSDMGIYAAKYLQRLLPLLRNVLSNPFGTAAPDLLLGALGLMRTLVEVCWPRVQERWWGECLRACVGCWLVVCEDEGNGKEERLGKVTRELQELVAFLADVVGEEFSKATGRLIEEDEGLVELFALVQSSEASG